MPEALARLLAQARRGGAKVPNNAGEGLTREGAFEVQERLAASFGPVGGFKVACPPDAPMVIAPIYSSDIHDSPATLSIPAQEAVGVEMEYAFRLIDPLPDTTAPDFDTRLRSAVELLPVIELVHSRITDPVAADPLLKMADNQINGAVVLGDPLRDWRAQDVTCAKALLQAGSNLLLDGDAKVPGGDAFETLRKFALAIGTHCGGWQPGQVVITGSLNGLPWLRPGLSIAGQIEGLGVLKVQLNAA